MSDENEYKLLKNELVELMQQSQQLFTPGSESEKEKAYHSLPYLPRAKCKNYMLFDLNQSCFINSHIIPRDKHLLSDHFNDLCALIHPDDCIRGLKMLLAGYKFLLQLADEDVNDFLLIYQLRIKSSEGKYHCYIFNYKVMAQNEAGIPWLILLSMQRCSMLSTDMEKRLKLYFVEPYIQFKRSKIPGLSEFVTLTPRQKEVAGLVNQGHTQNQIADIIFRSPLTVKKHYFNIILKTAIDSITRACLFLEKLGLFD